MTGRSNKMLYILFAVYCAAMLYLLFGREEAAAGLPYPQQLMMRLNLRPFHTIGRQMELLFDFDRPWLIRHAFVNLIGNVALFVPLGIFLPTLCQRLRALWRVLLAVTLIIGLVELTQVLTLLGRCDIDDLILNTLGAALGYGMYKGIFAR